MLKAELLTEDDEAQYVDFLKQNGFSTAQHSLGWRNTISDLAEDEPYFIIAKKSDKIVGVLPLYNYKCKFGSLLTTTSFYTTSSIIYSKDIRCREVYKTLLDRCVKTAKELDCMAISVATTPFLDDKKYYMESLKPDYILENFVQFIALDDIFDEEGQIVHPNYVTRSDLSRNIRKAEMQPINIVDEQTHFNVNKWISIYEKRMLEIGATPLPQKLFHSVLKNLITKKKGKYIFVLYRGKMISGSLFTFNRNMLSAFMIAGKSNYREIRANYSMTYHMLKWANKQDIPIFNWMSSRKRGDGVYRWKEKWGSQESTFSYLTKILGDISLWKEQSYKKLERAYQFHYSLPFNFLKNSHSRSTTKDEVASFMEHN